jgi:hypothetical protein
MSDDRLSSQPLVIPPYPQPQLAHAERNVDVRRRVWFRWGIVAVVVAVVLCLWLTLRPSNDTAGAAGAADTVYITNTGKKYHRAGCNYLRQSQHALPLEDAIKRGYGPCSKCNP